MNKLNIKNIVGVIAALALIMAIGQSGAQAVTVLYPEGGGTGTTTIPTLGQVLVGQSDGTYAPQATSTLGISGGGSATTTINGALGPNLIASSSNSAFTYSTTTSTFILDVSTSTLTSQLTGFATGTNFWTGLLGGSISNINSGNVGIGTSTPDFKLTLGNGQFAVPDGSVATPTIAFVNDSNFGIFRDIDGDMVFADGGTAWLRIDSSSHQLNSQLIGNASAPNFSFSADPNTGMYKDGSGDVNRLAFSTTGSERILIDATGNVGLSTTTPSAKLAVTGTSGTGDIFALASSTNSRLLTLKSTGRLGLGTSSPTALMEINNASDASGGPLIIRRASGQASTGYSFRVVDSANSDLLTHFRFNNVGSVLQIAEGSKYFQMEAYSADQLYFSVSGGNFRIRTLDANPIQLFTNNTVRLSLSSGGDFQWNNIWKTPNIIFQLAGSFDNNLFQVTTATDRVGINTSSPNAKLDILASGATTTAQLRLSYGADINQYLQFTTGSAGTTTIDAAGTSPSIWFQDPVRLNSSLLDVTGSAGTIGMVLQTTGTSTRWVATSTLGISGGSGTGSNWTIESGGLRTSTTTDYAKASYFIATSTTATSTFAGPVAFRNNTWKEHNLQFMDLQRTGTDYTLQRIRAPRGSSHEATLSLVVDLSSTDTGIDEEFVDFYNERYSDSVQWGLRQAYSGTGIPKPFVLGFWNTAGGKDAGNALIILPSKSIGMGMTATSSVATNAILHIASSTQTYLTKWDSTPGTNLGVFTSTGRLGIGTSTPVNPLHVLNSTSPQARIGNTSSQYMTIGVDGVGSTTIDVTGTSPAIVLNDWTYIPSGQGLSVGSINNQAYQFNVVGTNNTTGIGDLGLLGSVQLGTTNGNTIGYQHAQANTSGTLQTVAGWDFVGDSHTVGAQSASIAFTTRNAGSFGERMRISFNGNVGIASSSPAYKLTVVGTVGFNGLSAVTGGNAICLNATTFSVQNAGAGSCATSARRFKKNIESLSGNEAFGILEKLNSVKFDYIEGQYDSNETSRSYGLIAEDVEKIDPALVDYGFEGETVTLHFEKITGLLVAAVNDLNVRIGESSGVAKRNVEEDWQWYTITILGVFLVLQQMQISGLKKRR